MEKGFYLNNYLLSEGRPHVAPLSSLRWRVSTTKHGLFLLANLQSVTENNLRSWFGLEFLRRSVVGRCLPAKLAGLQETELASLYSTCKAILAACPGVDEAPRVQLLQLIEELNPQQIHYPANMAECRLQTLLPGKAGWSALFCLMGIPNHPPKRPGSYSTVDVIHQQLLSHGQSIGFVVRSLLSRSLFIRPALTDLVQWCSDYHRGLEEFKGENLIALAQRLGRTDLADNLFHQLLATQPDPHNILDFRVRLGSFCLYANDNRFRHQVTFFTQSLLGNELVRNWQDVSLLVTTLRFFVRTAQDDLFREYFGKLLATNVIFSDESLELIQDLIAHGYRNEAAQVVRKLLTIDHTRLACLHTMNIPSFFEIAFQLVGPASCVAGLREIVECGGFGFTSKLEALIYLAKHVQNEREYVAQKLATLRPVSLSTKTPHVMSIKNPHPRVKNFSLAPPSFVVFYFCNLAL